MTKIKEFKNGAWTVYEKTDTGMYLVKVYAPNGSLHDRVLVDDRRMAADYLKAFQGIAKNF